MPFKDPEEYRAYQDRYRKDNAERRRLQQAERARERVEWFEEYMRGKVCAHCSTTENLQHHHIDRTTKLFNVRRAVGQGMIVSRIEAEIKKCIILCASCHRKEDARLQKEARTSA